MQAVGHVKKTVKKNCKIYSVCMKGFQGGESVTGQKLCLHCLAEAMWFEML